MGGVVSDAWDSVTGVVEDVWDAGTDIVDTVMDPLFDEGEGDSGLFGGWVGQAGGQLDDLIMDTGGILISTAAAIGSSGIETAGEFAGGILDTGLDIIDAGGQLLQGDFGGALDDLEDAGEAAYGAGESLVSGIGAVGDDLWEGAEGIYEQTRDYAIHSLLGFPTDAEIRRQVEDWGSSRKVSPLPQGLPMSGGDGGATYTKEVEEIITTIASEDSRPGRRNSGVQDKFGSMKPPTLDDTTEKRPD